MSRATNSLLAGAAYSNGIPNSMLNLALGGQNGYAPNLSEIINNQAYMRGNLYCILLEAPKFFQLMPNPDQWVASLKALMELHAKTIEGFNAGLTVEFDEHPVGGAGEFQQEFTDVKRARTEPVITAVEKYGMPIQNLLYNWITYGMMDPDTKTALVSTLGADAPADLLADWFTMTCLFFEPDRSFKKIQKAWITCNMMPKGTGEVIGKRDLTAASEITTLSIEFTGLSQANTLGARNFAQVILDSIMIDNANPYLRPAFIQGISSDVAAAANTGLANNANTLSQEAVNGGAKF